MSTRVYGLSDPALRESAVDLQRIVSLATAALSTFIHEAHRRDLPGRDGAASTVAWLRELLRVTAAEARSLIAVGEILDARITLADAVSAGVVNVGQVLAIGHVLRDVPADEPALADKVEGVLAEHAQHFEPMILRRLGERVLAHVNPGLGRRPTPRSTRTGRTTCAATSWIHNVVRRAGRRVGSPVWLIAKARQSSARRSNRLPRPRRDGTGPDLRTPAARRADALVDGVPPCAPVQRVCRTAVVRSPQVVVTIDYAALRTRCRRRASRHRPGVITSGDAAASLRRRDPAGRSQRVGGAGRCRPEPPALHRRCPYGRSPPRPGMCLSGL